MIAEEDKWRLQHEKKIIDEEIARIHAEQEEKRMRDTITKKNH
jgi:hypothetical protein